MTLSGLGDKVGGATTLLKILVGIVAAAVVALVIFVLKRSSRPQTLADKVADLVDEGRVEEAGRMLIEDGQEHEALLLFVQHGRQRDAAKLHAFMGDHAKAAAMFKEMGDLEAAANAYLKMGDRKSAAETYLKAGKREMAAETFLAGGEPREAAKIYIQLKQYQRAAQVLLDSGDKTRAAAALAAHYVGLGDWAKAAKNFLASGRPRQAAEAFSRAGVHDSAAQLYEQVGDFMLAARSRLQGGEVEKAAEHFERVGDLKSAIRLFEAAGKWNKVVECYRREKNWLALGNIMMRLQQTEMAVEFFKRMTPLDDGYMEASMSMGSILESLGDSDGARKKYGEVLGFRGVGAKTAHALFALCTLCERTQTADYVLPFLHQVRESEQTSFGQNVVLWTNRLEQMVIAQGQTLAIGIQVANEEDMKKGAVDASAGMSLPQRTSIADRYEITDKIGQGGHGVIYRAHDKFLGRTVVLKFLFRNQVPSEVARMYFLREARTTALLNHKNIVTLFDMGQVGENLYIAMEYIKGIDLEERLHQEAPLSFPEIMAIIDQLCDALQYAHEKHIIHRDLKPGNVMLTGENRDVVKLMDFGLAKVLDENPHKTLIICGTPLYMSPEQIVGDFVDHLSDIYSLGIMVFQLFTGQTPFPSANILAHHQFTPPPHPTTIDKRIPLAVGDVILRCLEKKREKPLPRRLVVCERPARGHGWRSRIFRHGKRRVHPGGNELTETTSLGFQQGPLALRTSAIPCPGRPPRVTAVLPAPVAAAAPLLGRRDPLHPLAVRVKNFHGLTWSRDSEKGLGGSSHQTARGHPR